jgi:hypothetical protein
VLELGKIRPGDFDFATDTSGARVCKGCLDGALIGIETNDWREILKSRSASIVRFRRQSCPSCSVVTTPMREAEIRSTKTRRDIGKQ